MPPCIQIAACYEWRTSIARRRPGRATWCRTSKSATAVHPAAPHRRPAADTARNSRVPTAAARIQPGQCQSGIRRCSATDRAKFRASAHLYPGIKQRIEKVDGEHADRYAENRDRGDTEHQAVVTGVDRIDQQRADARIAEHLLGDHRPVKDTS